MKALNALHKNTSTFGIIKFANDEKSTTQGSFTAAWLQKHSIACPPCHISRNRIYYMR